jgi:hypothetical protein
LGNNVFRVVKNASSGDLTTISPETQLDAKVSRSGDTMSGPLINMSGFVGDGSGLNHLNADNFTTGMLPVAQLPAAALTNHASDVSLAGIFSGDGSGLTNLSLGNVSASSLTSGTLPLAQLPDAVVTNNAIGVRLDGTFTGDGGGLTNLAPARLTAGTAGISISGNAATASTAATAGTFTGSLAGDVTGTQGATVVANVGGQSAASVASGASVANAATSANTANTLVKRAGLTSLNAANLSGTIPLAQLPGVVLTNAATGPIALALGNNSTASGWASTAIGYYTTAGGTAANAFGFWTAAYGDSSTAMGSGTMASGNYSTALGKNSVASGPVSFAAGSNTLASGFGAVAMGVNTKAANDYSTALGYNAQATNAGSFVWADSSSSSITSSTNDNSVTLRASGGYRLYSGSSAGVYLAANGTSWATISDRNAKKNFTAVNGAEVLNKLAAIPIQQWNYKWENDADVLNMGPMAQDFKQAFYPGRDDKSITTLEFDGVELAAIQGLNQKLEAETKAKDAEIQELKQSVAELKQLVQTLVEKK